MVSACSVSRCPYEVVCLHLPSVLPGNGNGTAATMATRPNTIANVKCILSSAIEHLVLWWRV